MKNVFLTLFKKWNLNPYLYRYYVLKALFNIPAFVLEIQYDNDNVNINLLITFNDVTSPIEIEY